jgi:hypothetical protein
MYCSEIPNEVFQTARGHTNAVEQTHYKSNSMGKRLSLVHAIQRYF